MKIGNKYVKSKPYLLGEGGLPDPINPYPCYISQDGGKIIDTSNFDEFSLYTFLLILWKKEVRTSYHGFKLFQILPGTVRKLR